MEKKNVGKLMMNMSRMILRVSDYFADFENPKSTPWWFFEVKIPDVLKDRGDEDDISTRGI